MKLLSDSQTVIISYDKTLVFFDFEQGKKTKLIENILAFTGWFAINSSETQVALSRGRELSFLNLGDIIPEKEETKAAEITTKKADMKTLTSDNSKEGNAARRKEILKDLPITRMILC